MRAAYAVMAPTTCSGFSVATALRKFQPAESLIWLSIKAHRLARFHCHTNLETCTEELSVLNSKLIAPPVHGRPRITPGPDAQCNQVARRQQPEIAKHPPVAKQHSAGQ